MKNLTTCTVDRSGEESYPFDVDDIDYFAFLERESGEDSEITVGVGGRMFLFKGKAARGIHSLVSKSIS
ncbi:hypothetical protein GCM10027443_05510 [Pontibacter brevis]